MGTRKKPAPAAAATIRNRIKGHRRVRASDLVPHEHNFRLHPESQRQALAGLYQQVGFARSLLAFELPDGRLKLIDGHLRAEITPDMEVEVEVLDVTAEEAKLLLASVDPLAALAESDGAKLAELLGQVQSDSAAVQDLLAGLAEQATPADKDTTILQAVDTRPPPQMSWALVGIPTVRFGEIAALVEQLALVPGILLETTSNDANPDQDR